MAEIIYRKPENIAGRFYVDDTCIDCDQCRDMAPDFFRRDPDSGQSIVFKQPATSEEMDSALAALEACPTSSIGDAEEAE